MSDFPDHLELKTMKPILTLVLLLNILQSIQAQNCYQIFLEEGIRAYNELDFDKAINQFQAAKICDDITSENEVNEWITKTQNGYIEVIQLARDSAILLKAEARKYYEEATKVKKEAEALRFFVDGQEWEFKGFLLQAIDAYTEAIKLQPTELRYREKRALLVLNDTITRYDLARQDLSLLANTGPKELKATYFNDLAFVMAKMNDFNGAAFAQSQALMFAAEEDKAVYKGKLSAYRAREFWEPGSEIDNKVILKIKSLSQATGCNKKITIKIDGKTFGVKNNDRIELTGLKPGTYSYEISGYIKCEHSGSNQGGLILDRKSRKPWPAIGKGSITIRSNGTYQMYWKEIGYGKCEVTINNY